MEPTVYTYNLQLNPLSLRDLGGGEGIGFAVTSSFTYRYRAFRMCQTMALAEGSLRLFESISVRLWNSHISRKTIKNRLLK